MKRILLIGSNGQVGWELQSTLAPLGAVQALDQPPVRDFGRTMGQPWARRAALIAFTVLTTVLAVVVLHDAFSADFLTGAEVVHLVLFASLFAVPAMMFLIWRDRKAKAAE